jgi:hypothetical protein
MGGRGPEEQGAKRKRRERELEQQLMRGELSSITGASGGRGEGVVVLDVAAGQGWAGSEELRNKYHDGKAMEAAVLREFGIGVEGASTSLTQVTKVQNKRHQLSSLAIKAAQVELSLLESRGARARTKSETQGKYGW